MKYPFSILLEFAVVVIHSTFDFFYNFEKRVIILLTVAVLPYFSRPLPSAYLYYYNRNSLYGGFI